jgi:hypothetical protein
MPFPFYNTAPPTPSTKNNITDIAVTYGIRDFLLNKNLPPVYPFIATNINGSPHIGEPVLDTSINGNANVTPLGLPLEIEGINRYNTAIVSNQFKNDQPTAPSLIDIGNITKTQGVFGSIDFPQGTQSYPTSSSQQVTEYGLLGKTQYAGFRKNSTLYNLYLDTTKQVDTSDWITLKPAGFTQQITGYLDQYGSLNLGDSNGIQAANIIGSVLNGQGLGLSKGGVVPNFDIRSSLAGRVLGATGAIHDTKLGMIGGQQLALALANNAAFNIQQDILGALNVQDNILALVKGGPLPGFRPNYQITVPSSTGGKIADYTEKVLGFTIPRSYLQDAGSIFSSENQSGNIQRANAMLENTGKGQRQALIANMFANINGTGGYDNPTSTAFRSGYVPGHAKGESKPDLNPSLYAYYDDITKGTILNFMAHSSGATDLIPKISYDRSNMIKAYGFLTPEDTYSGPNGNTGYDNRKVSDVGFTWNTGNGDALNKLGNYDELPITNKKSLLYKTQKLFNSKGMLNIVSVSGDMGSAKGDGQHSSQIETANAHGFSKGNAVIQGTRYSEDGIFDGKKDTADNTYCRSWTTLNRYDQVKKMVRHRGLDETYPYRHQMSNSVLDDNGFAKISPYSDDTEPKKYMFSLENLAWCDNIDDLIPCEQGIGDLLTGKKGRIMWFPPYDLNFNESSSVSWEKTDFIGRGEPVYTYNNTERSGNLSFKIIIDHASYINSFSRSTNSPDDHYVASFFAGCVEPTQYFVDRLTSSEIQSVITDNTVKPQQSTAPEEPVPLSFKVYYPNDVIDFNYILNGYENGLQNNSATPTDKIDYDANPTGEGFGLGDITGEITPPQNSNGQVMVDWPKSKYPDNHNYGLNGWKSTLELNGQKYSGFTDPAYIPALSDYLNTTCKHCKINIQSAASPQGYEPYNTNLATGRTQSVYEFLKQNLTGIDSGRFVVSKTSKPITNSACKKYQNVKHTSDSKECKVDRYSEVSFVFDQESANADCNPPQPVEQTQPKTLNTKITNRFYSECSYFEKMTQENKFVFDSFREKIKYFHPAFHSTTPEGFNSRLTFLQQCTRQGPTLESVDANNLAFGRPPVCILRIGDFYNTKIVIDNISFEYEPLVWDLNPEGVGVQPMIANVNISFKFIGGSTLMGAINKLQNALSFNYYANTHVYDARADYISLEKPFIKVRNQDNTISQKEVKDSATGYYINNLINDEYFGNANIFSNQVSVDGNFTVLENGPTINQTAANDNASGSKSQQSQQMVQNDAERLMISDAQYENGNITFALTRRDMFDNTSLTQSYKLITTIQSTDSTKVVYTYKTEEILDATDLAKNISFFTADLNPNGPSSLDSSYNIITVQLKATPYKLKANLKFI